jgi:hypothetical protein
MKKKKQYVLFKDKEKLVDNFNEFKIGKLAKIFLPSWFRGMYWPENQSFVYGMMLSKRIETGGDRWLFYRLKMLIGMQTYEFIWIKILKTNKCRMLDIKPVTQLDQNQP